MTRRLLALALLVVVGGVGGGVASAAAGASDPPGRCITVGSPKVANKPVMQPLTICLPGKTPGALGS